MLFNYTGKLTTSLADSPVLNFTMTAKSTGNQIPCFLNVGSCQYKLCGGTTTVEQQIAAPWNNQCPIPVMTYTSSVAIAIPALASLIIGVGLIALLPARGALKVPTVLSVYKLCGGTSSIERQIGQPWNNECPIPASNYSSSLSMKIPSLAAFFIGVKCGVGQSRTQDFCTRFLAKSPVRAPGRPQRQGPPPHFCTRTIDSGRRVVVADEGQTWTDLVRKSTDEAPPTLLQNKHMS
ncbi:hypothetical protein HPB47_024025 [Ixodes persulcatus]|uniref:Uncharacterized protein n=1 Tax=Ixodes persulcatus TaxID=34615 RepID=A0AC60Q7L6_IXOPE|nr:hypothetical protein HPB47_024025 [Ixodes persulcatus]